MKRVMCEDIQQFQEATKDFNWSKFSLDTETNSKLRFADINLNEKTWKNGISLYDGNMVVYVHNEYGHLKLCTDTINLNNSSLIFMHNAPFDAKVLLKQGINISNSEWFDTLVAQHLIDETSPKDLKTLAARYLGVDIVRYEEAKLSKEKFCEYAMDDAIYTFQLATIFREKLLEQGLDKLFRKIEMPFLRVIVEMETTGFCVDVERLETIRKELKEYINSLVQKMCTWLKVKPIIQVTLNGDMTIISPVDFNSPLQLRKVLFEDLGIESVGKTETGKEKTGKEFLLKMKGKHEFVDMLAEYRKVSKLSSSFFESLPGFIDDDNRIRSSFKDTGTRTGRLSSNNPNLQQLPKPDDESNLPSVRSLFIATPGKTLITADYSGQELRVLAQVTQDTGLIQAFNSGRDFHQETANMFGVSRTIAKQINFGIAYRKGAYGFAQDWGVTEEEAQKYLDTYFSQFPRVKEAMEKTDKFLDENGYVVTLAGRRRRFQREDWGYPRKSYREAFNFLIQGFSADMIRVAGIHLLNLKRRHKEWEMNILACVHDEYVVEVKDEHTNIAMLAIKEAMENSVNLCVPVLADVNSGKNYHEAK